MSPKVINFEVPAGKFLRSLQFLRRYKLALRGIKSEVLVGEFCANVVLNSNVGFRFRARGRVYQDMKRQISLCTAHSSSDPTNWKRFGRLL